MVGKMIWDIFLPRLKVEFRIYSQFVFKVPEWRNGRRARLKIVSREG